MDSPEGIRVNICAGHWHRAPCKKSFSWIIKLFSTALPFETSFDSKQPKLVSALSETKCLFRLFHFYTVTESFDVSIDLKQTKDQPKQFDRHFGIFSENLGFFCFFRVFWFNWVCFKTVCFGCFASIPKQSFDVSIEPKQTEDQPKQFEREHILVFFRKFWVVLVCLGLFWNSSVFSVKQTETKA